MANGDLSDEERLIEQQFARSSAGNPGGWAGQPPVTADPANQGNGGFLGLAGHPLSWILALAPHNPDLAAHLMAMLGKAPGHKPRGAGETPRTQEDAGPTPQGTTVAPARPTFAPGQIRQGPTGELGGPFPSSTGITGSDGQSIAPAPTSFSGSQPPLPMLKPDTPSVKDTSTTGAGVEGGGAPMGVAHPSATETMTPLPGSPEVQSDPSATDQMKKIGDVLQSAFGSIKMPQDKWTPMPQPQLPQTTHRFSPTDLLSLVGQLSTPAQKQAVSSLGALIGR
jgi:hypothetical protein